MRDLPSDIETDAVVDAVADGWGFDADAIEYAAVGAGSYHWIAADAAGARRFVTVDDLDQKRWLGETRDAARQALGRAFDTAVALRQAGLEFVVAPIPTSGGEPLRRIGERHTVALFPFVDGRGRPLGAVRARRPRGRRRDAGRAAPALGRRPRAHRRPRVHRPPACSRRRSER